MQREFQYRHTLPGAFSVSDIGGPRTLATCVWFRPTKFRLFRSAWESPSSFDAPVGFVPSCVLPAVCALSPRAATVDFLESATARVERELVAVEGFEIAAGDTAALDVELSGRSQPFRRRAAPTRMKSFDSRIGITHHFSHRPSDLMDSQRLPSRCGANVAHPWRVRTVSSPGPKSAVRSMAWN